MLKDDYKRSIGPADAVVGGFTGWVFLLVGCAAIASAALIPAYFQTIQIQERRASQSIRAEQLAQEHARYRDFHQALRDSDPVLLERLAISELRLRPVGTQVAERVPRDPVALVDRPTQRALHEAMARQPMSRSIENELSRPDLRDASRIEVELDRPRQTRLVAAVTGEHRPWVAGVGALLLIAGLWPRRLARSIPR